MANNNKTNPKFPSGNNSSVNHTNSSVNVRNSSVNDVNSSFISSNINMLADSKNIVKYLPVMTHKKNDVTGVVTHFLDFSDSEKQGFTSHDNKRYYRDLSKLVSGRASRHLLAFFVPDNSSASQAVTIYSSIAPRAHLSALRGQTIISIASHLLTDYDGLTLQNKRAVRRICGAVSNKTESKTRHPISLLYSVALTQNLTGGSYHG